MQLLNICEMWVRKCTYSLLFCFSNSGNTQSIMINVEKTIFSEILKEILLKLNFAFENTAFAWPGVRPFVHSSLTCLKLSIFIFLAQTHFKGIQRALSKHLASTQRARNQRALQALREQYRVTIKERYKVLLYCEPNLRSSDLLRLLGANQIWSIW